jgi:hypothetical protein
MGVRGNAYKLLVERYERRIVRRSRKILKWTVGVIGGRVLDSSMCG